MSSQGQQESNQSQPQYVQLLHQYKFDNLEELNQALFIREENIRYKNHHNFHKAQISQQEIEIGKKLSYKELLQMYSLKESLILQGKRIIRYKYYYDDIIRAHQFHKAFWKVLSKAEFKIKEHKEYYSVLNSEFYPEYFKKVIQADVHRTLQQKTEQNQQKLSSILRNIAKRNPYIGYCQGMNFIINFLIIMQFKEQEIFWIMNALLEQYLPSNYYTNMLGVAVDLKIIEQFLRLKRPKLYNKLQELSINISIFALQWIVCLFTTIFPYYMLVILWDLLFLQGSSVILKATIILIDEIEPIIMDCNQIISFLTKVQTFKKKTHIEEGMFFSRLKAIFIDRQLLQLARNIYSQLMVEESKDQRKKKVPAIACHLKWPICHELMNRNKVQRKDSQIWVFKDEGPPKLIQNYLQSKLKGVKVFVQDNRNPLKKLSIGRTHHICNSEFNDILRGSRANIQLSQYDAQTNSYELPANSVINQSSRRFLIRATFISQTFLFNINSKS